MSEKREIVLPGELLCEKAGRKVGYGVYLEGEKVFSKVLGIPNIGENEVFVIPLAGAYMPRVGDRVIGKILSVEISGWMIDINSPYVAFLPLAEGVGEFVDISRTDISRYFDVDDVVFCTVSKVTKDKTIQVSMRNIGSRKLYGGVLIKINPNKVPRIIGKGGSMINIIKKKTNCEIYTGRNGYIWIRGENKSKAIEAILTIEKESHTIGLTEKIEKMLS
ncbi:MAG: exosome complex RNA-binding protein Rrp4 [Candidatus Aenigmatarchaeota archaeon]